MVKVPNAELVRVQKGPEERVPSQWSLMWPIIAALRTLDGPTTTKAIDESAANIANCSEAAVRKLHGLGPKTELSYRFGWARHHLRKCGLIEPTARAVWRLTDLGRNISQGDVLALSRIRGKGKSV